MTRYVTASNNEMDILLFKSPEQLDPGIRPWPGKTPPAFVTHLRSEARSFDDLLSILSNGLKYQPITATADEAQWVETRKHQINEVCRFFRVQPVMIQANENATSYNSIEQLFLSHLTHTLMPWFERFEQSAYMNLLTPADKKAGYYIKLNEKALLRASTAERTAYYNAGRTQGWLTANEVREKEDLARSTDPKADELSPAANLFGKQPTSTDDEATNDDN